MNEIHFIYHKKLTLGLGIKKLASRSLYHRHPCTSHCPHCPHPHHWHKCPLGSTHHPWSPLNRHQTVGCHHVPNLCPFICLCFSLALVIIIFLKIHSQEVKCSLESIHARIGLSWCAGLRCLRWGGVRAGLLFDDRLGGSLGGLYELLVGVNLS